MEAWNNGIMEQEERMECWKDGQKRKSGMMEEWNIGEKIDQNRRMKVEV
jgi:hypothetical protein